ncbi:MAG: biotin/lipoyl-containing protein [Candidatus Bathyarchaeia archaeon]
MPAYEVLIDGKARKVEIAKADAQFFEVKTGDKLVRVELAEKLEFEKPFTMTVDGKAYKISLSKTEQEKIVTVKVDEASFRAELRTPATKTSAINYAPTKSANLVKKLIPQKTLTENAVTAPMTGKIVRVIAKKGDLVKKGQVLCVLEAMKMENEVTAPKDGTVQEVNTSEGSPVNEGEVLFVVA